MEYQLIHLAIQTTIMPNGGISKSYLKVSKKGKKPDVWRGKRREGERCTVEIHTLLLMGYLLAREPEE